MATSKRELESQLFELILLSAELLGAEGGAIGTVTGSKCQLIVRDIYKPKIAKNEPLSNSFLLPVDQTMGSGWHKVLEERNCWLADLSDPRFPEGFQNYHMQGERNYFAHFPINNGGSINGFLGLSFTNRRQIAEIHLKTVQSMAAHAGLKIELDRTNCFTEKPSTYNFQIKLLEYIDTKINYSDWHSLSNKSLADYFGYSTRHFHYKFSREFGNAPHLFILKRRLEMARNLLLSGDSISAIACRFGFSDQAHFAKQFRASYGCSPTEALLAENLRKAPNSSQQSP